MLNGRFRAMEVEVEYLGRSHSRERVREKVSSVSHHRLLEYYVSWPYLNRQSEVRGTCIGEIWVKHQRED